MTLNIRGQLLPLSPPIVMGILNVTPDSFYPGSRVSDTKDLVDRARKHLSEGATILDVGACSTRPDAAQPTSEEESARLRPALQALRQALPDAILSVDTYRADVARMAVEEYGVDIINDIAGGALDPNMFPTVAQLRTPYVLTHYTPVPPTENTAATVLRDLAYRAQQLQDLGCKDIILDPGFGFNKTLEQNYELLADLPLLRQLSLPVLVGISRKSMIQRPLHVDPTHALNGTTVLHTIILRQHAADILRVHDTLPAMQAITLTQTLSHD